ncbi:transposase [Clostridium sp. CX1]|uniref:transposase n=1 Tax=Clostridium sp. CX1 TaxID=2978346 RepID=UPI0021C2306C|nr:transposase [Clostridium sp. CX1]MCT8978334.1 transposase [Clostridium sp. CX1]
MPRTARKKGLSHIHHIMSRSVSEIQLFRESSDKDKFMNILRKYQKANKFLVYSFVLMDTHYHLEICDNGADISKFMKSINQSYAQYYNRKYERHGHVFADRFKSKPIEEDAYAVTASVYIHSNPKDIKEYTNNIQDYPYSSLKTYLVNKSPFSDIININFILERFGKNINTARKTYLELVLRSTSSDIEKEIEFQEKEQCYVAERHLLIRDFKPENVVDFVSKYTKKAFCIHAKYTHKNSELKSVCVFLLRALCGFSLTGICDVIGNTTTSNIWRLYEKGVSLVSTDERYKNIINDFIEYSKTA